MIARQAIAGLGVASPTPRRIAPRRGVRANPAITNNNIRGRSHVSAVVAGVSYTSNDPDPDSGLPPLDPFLPFTRAFLWEDGGPSVDLNALIPPNSALKLTTAALITENGEIVGVGKPLGCADDDDSCGHAYVLVPCDENHPNLRGCDYNLVDASDTTQGRLAQVDSASGGAGVADLFPAERVRRVRSMMSSHNRSVRSLVADLAKK